MRRHGPVTVLSLFLPLLLSGFFAQTADPPVITAISDSNPTLSGRVAIVGSGFGTEGEVLIAGLSAWTTTWTDTRVTAYVPEEAPLGPTSLVIVAHGQQSNQVPLTTTARQAEGRVRWTFQVDGDNMRWRPALAPDGTVYVHTYNSSGGLVYALSPDGGLKWVQKVIASPYVPPSAGPDGAVYVGTVSRIYRISPQGNIDWMYRDSGSPGPRLSPTIGPDGLLYGAFDVGIGAFAMEPLTGELVWSNIGEPHLYDKSGEATEAKFGPSGPGQPVDRFYVSMDGGAGFYSFSLNGVQQFTANLSNVHRTAEAAIGSDGTIYGPRSQGIKVVALSPSNGSTLWEYYPHDWAVGTDNVEIGPDDMLYFSASGGKLEAFDPSSQSRRWQVFEPDMVLKRPSISPDGSVLVVHGSPGYNAPGFVKGLSPRRGKELWTVNLAGGPYPEPSTLGVHHARITPDSTTAYVSTLILASSPEDRYASLYAIDLKSTTSGDSGGGKGGGKGGGGGKPK